MQYNITLFASGNGSNVENIINYFKESQKINIELIICNSKKAFVIQRVKKYNIPIKIRVPHVRVTFPHINIFHSLFWISSST